VSHSIEYRHESPVGRLPITSVSPVVDGGRWPTKAFAGEMVAFSSVVFREGHDALGVELLLIAPDGKSQTIRMSEGAAGSDSWHTKALISSEGIWKFKIQAFSDEYGTWHHNTEVKLAAGVDQDLMMLEGVRLFTNAAAEKGRSKASALTLVNLAEVLSDASISHLDRLHAAEAPEILATLAKEPIRALVTHSDEYVIRSERRLAGSGAWYEFFPRSEGAKFNAKAGEWKSGTFKTAMKRLPAVAEMGFEVLYMPPIHPIGFAHRKGPNNTLVVAEGDPGSPWAIGSEAGGHDAIHPDLGTIKDFEKFVVEANKLGIEVAMDFALQASPDHPWVKEHPEWFTTRADGSIAYAENPPKKYQDIYPINFDNDRDGFYREAHRLLKFWIAKGVKIFRVDNPHTKPVNFWEWVIGEINAEYPEVIFLAEAFTRPAMMHTLGKIGYQQSYTYFTWRNSKWELTEYLNELAHESSAFFRPNLWVTTPDILPPYLQTGGVNGHKIRAALAALAGSSWGMYAGYELVEATPRPGAEEHIDSEKYQYKQRDWDGAAKTGKTIAPYITKLNEIRKTHPAIGQIRNLETHSSTDDAIFVFSKHLAAEHSTTGKADTVIVVVNLDPHNVREGDIHLDLWKLDLSYDEPFKVTDLMTGDSRSISAKSYIRIDPSVQPAVVLRVDRGK
jgi:starch synthase (maltosyl-transferring)